MLFRGQTAIEARFDEFLSIRIGRDATLGRFDGHGLLRLDSRCAQMRRATRPMTVYSGSMPLEKCGTQSARYSPRTVHRASVARTWPVFAATAGGRANGFGGPSVNLEKGRGRHAKHGSVELVFEPRPAEGRVDPGAATAAGRDDSIRSPTLVAQDRVANGESVAQVLAGLANSGKGQLKTGGNAGAIALPQALLPGGGTNSGAATQPTSSTQAPRQDPSGALLDYLLGGSG
jgi:hypothetical protein